VVHPRRVVGSALLRYHRVDSAKREVVITTMKGDVWPCFQFSRLRASITCGHIRSINAETETPTMNPSELSDISMAAFEMRT
jgi:hypothetical protein